MTYVGLINIFRGSGFFWVTLYVYEKIKQKKTPVVYKTDQIANLHGQEVLRTLVQHCIHLTPDSFNSYKKCTTVLKP
jgi:predicted oxidoreductase (fatty acid repression mutant protein)